MNETKALILIKKENQWIDITKKYRNSDKLDDNKIQINYLNNQSQIISKDEFRYENFLENRNVDKIIIHFNNNPLINVTDIYISKNYVKVKFSDGNYNFYDKDEIIILAKNQDENVNSYIEYLSRVSIYIDDHNNDEKPNRYLTNQIRLLGDFSDSILYNILYSKHDFELENLNDNLIFPFSYNQSQIDAIKNALNNNISVIEGPPGTGKTQTILNIIANLIINNKTIAIVSSNNEATKNIQEKLSKYNLDFISAFLGNIDNMKKFFNTPQPIPAVAHEWKLTNDSKHKMEKRIKELIELNCENLTNEIEHAKLKMQIMELEIENKNFSKLFKIDFDKIPLELKNADLSHEQIFILKSHIQLHNQRWNIKAWFFKNKIKKKYKFNLSDKNNIILINIVNFLDKKYYESKLIELNRKCESFDVIIKNFNHNKYQEEIYDHSLSLLRDKIYHSYLNRMEFTSTNYKNDFENFTRTFPIIFSTTNSLKNSISPDFKFDYIIMDESSQIDLISSTIALSCAKNLVLVGDLKQISVVIDSKHKNGLNEIFNNFDDVLENWNYVNNSLLSSVIGEFNENLPRTFLNEHYRCDPEIISFCNKQFYNDKLIIKTEHKPTNGLKIIPAKSHGEIDNINEREIDTIMQDIIVKNNFFNSDIGIISPFRNQIEEIKKQFSKYNFNIDTVHKFQGREKEIVIMSTVKNKLTKIKPENDFINQPNLLNVIISRAKDKLYVVASKELLINNKSLYSDLFRYVQYYCDSDAIIEQQAYSVMDLLYKEYSLELQKYKEKLIKISDYKSENILASVIKEISDERKFGLLKWLNFYSLNRIIPINQIYENGVFKNKNGYQFTVEDLNFVRNSATHCDFVFFEKFGKNPIFVIELDGRRHRKKKQKQRDIRKDNLLKVFEIPILRVLTDNTQPKDKIEKFLFANNFSFKS